jgi:hypothetical protein
MAAQNAAIGIAVAAYYPSVSLSAAAGFSQSPLDALLHAANLVWSIGATGTETLFQQSQKNRRAIVLTRITVLGADELRWTLGSTQYRRISPPHTDMGSPQDDYAGG